MLQSQTMNRAAFKADSRTLLARPASCAVRVSVSGRTTRSAGSSSSVCRAAAVADVAAFKGDLLNPTYYPTSADASNSSKRWYVIDAEGQTLGRLASLAATYIRGKHLPTYHPAMDMGAFVIVVNAEKVTVSGSKTTDKTYFNHVNGRPGSYRVETFDQLQRRIPERIIERAVKGMLPKGALGRNIRLHLKVYKGGKHDHEAQQPADITKEVDLKPKLGPGAALLAAKRAEKK